MRSRSSTYGTEIKDDKGKGGAGGVGKKPQAGPTWSDKSKDKKATNWGSLGKAPAPAPPSGPIQITKPPVKPPAKPVPAPAPKPSTPAATTTTTTPSKKRR
jgi:hypothetical protein